MHLLHPGEMVVRAREAGMMRDAMGAGSQSQTGAMMAGYIRTTRGFPLPQAWVNREAPLPLQGGYGHIQRDLLGYLVGPGGPYPGTQMMSSKGWWWNSKRDLMGATQEGIASYATGAWQTADGLARHHAGEMVVPAREASQLRAALGPGADFGALAGMAAGARPSGLVSGPSASSGGVMSGMSGRSDGGGTIEIIVGDEVLARVSDKRLFIEGRLRANR